MSHLHKLLIALNVIAAIALLANRAVPQSVASARAIALDRQQFPKEAWGSLYYLDTDPWVGAEEKELKAAIKLMVCSTSIEPVIERTIPTELPGTTLMRIDIRELGWAFADWKQVLSTYPYFGAAKFGGLPAIVRADWLLVELADMQESNAYHLLLFGGKNPVKRRDDILNRLGVVNQRRHVFGLIEGQSGVAKQGTRWIENRPILRGYAWGTRDSLKLIEDKDPLEHPDGTQVHDGEEWIIGVPKVSIANDGARGTLQIYFLANGQGQLVNRAPVDLVEDGTKFRNYAEIRNPGSCIQCHGPSGLNLPTVNEFRELIKGGVYPFADDPKTAGDLQAFHLSDISKELERGNDDYQTMVEIVTGMTSGDASAAFKRSINRYDAELDLLAAAEELASFGYDVNQVTAALEWAANDGTVGARLSSLTRDKKIPRAAWEEQYLLVRSLIQVRSKNQ